MKNTRSRKTLRRFASLSTLGVVGLTSPIWGDLTLHYNFEDLTGISEGDPVTNLGSSGVDGIITNQDKVALTTGHIVTVGATRYLLGKSLDFVSIDAEGASAGHIDTGSLPEDLGMTNGATWNRDYTAMAWVNFRSTVGDNMVFGQVPTEALHLGSRNGFFHSGHWGDDIGPDQGINIATPINSWHHITFVNQGQTQSIYQDGVLVVGPGATGANANNALGNILIATAFDNGSFVGGLDEVKIFGDQALTVEEIQAEMTSGLTLYNLAAPSLAELTNAGYRFQFTDSPSSTVNTATVLLQIDGAAVTPTVVKEGGVTTVTYVATPSPIPGTTHTYSLTAKDQTNTDISSNGSLRAPYFPAAPLPGPAGGEGFWGMREVQVTEGWGATLEAAVQYLMELPETADPDDESIVIVDAANVPVVNHSDPDNSPNKGNFNNDFPLLSDQEGVDDNQLLSLSKTRLVVPAAGEYTFAARSDDGFGLRVTGGPVGNTGRFTAYYGNGTIDTSDPQTLAHPAPTGDSTTRGVYTFSAPGTYDVTFVAYEAAGGAFWELAWAPGHHPRERDTGSWSLVGNPNDPAVTAIPFTPRWPTELPGPLGGAGTWGIRTYLDAEAVDTLQQTMDFLANTDRTPADGDDLTLDVQSPFLNARDPDNTGVSGHLPDDVDFPGNLPGDDDRLVTVAKGRLQVDAAGPYTFSFRGDDGFLFRLKGVNGPNPIFKRVTRSNSADVNGRFEMSNPNEVFFEVGTGDSDTRGIIELAAGVYDAEYVHWEGAGGFWYEVGVVAGEHPHDGGTTPLWRALGGEGVTGTLTAPGLADPGWTVESATPGRPEFAFTIDGGEAAIDATLADDTAPAAKTSTWDVINFTDPEAGAEGSYSPSNPWPLNTPADDNNYAMRATGSLVITAAGEYHLGFQGDDGGYLIINGPGNPQWSEIVFSNHADLAMIVEEVPDSGINNAIRLEVGTGNSHTVGSITLEPGTYTLKAFVYEGGGGSWWELFGRQASAVPTSYPLLARGPGSVMEPIGLRLVDPNAAPGETLVVTSFTFDAATGQFSLTIESTAGDTYALEYTNGLQPAGEPASPAKWNVAPGFGAVASGGATTTINGNVSALLTTGGGLLPEGSVAFFRVRRL